MRKHFTQLIILIIIYASPLSLFSQTPKANDKSDKKAKKTLLKNLLIENDNIYGYKTYSYKGNKANSNKSFGPKVVLDPKSKQVKVGFEVLGKLNFTGGTKEITMRLASGDIIESIPVQGWQTIPKLGELFESYFFFVSLEDWGILENSFISILRLQDGSGIYLDVNNRDSSMKSSLKHAIYMRSDDVINHIKIIIRMIEEENGEVEITNSDFAAN